MTSSLIQTYPRLWTLESGVAMVVTDLHGDWDAYQRYRDRFVTLQDTGQADWLIFTGDLIHAEDPDGDRSLDIVLDVLALRRQYGSAIIYLCGNHELPHIYDFTLSKGKRLYTPAFEMELIESGRRAEVIALFEALPFYLRTPAGVAIAHAGAPAVISAPDKAQKLFNWSHQELLEWAKAAIAEEDTAALRIGYARQHDNIPYHLLVKHYLGITDPEDPRFNDLLRGFFVSHHPEFNELLWPALFTRNEEEYNLANYRIFLRALLQELSVDYTPQQMLVAGHMTIRGGWHVVADQHLRLASSRHATPREAGQYLLFDVARPISSPVELVEKLGTVFR